MGAGHSRSPSCAVWFVMGAKRELIRWTTGQKQGWGVRGWFHGSGMVGCQVDGSMEGRAHGQTDRRIDVGQFRGGVDEGPGS